MKSSWSVWQRAAFWIQTIYNCAFFLSSSSFYGRDRISLFLVMKAYNAQNLHQYLFSCSCPANELKNISWNFSLDLTPCISRLALLQNWIRGNHGVLNSSFHVVDLVTVGSTWTFSCLWKNNTDYMIHHILQTRASNAGNKVIS